MAVFALAAFLLAFPSIPASAGTALKGAEAKAELNKFSTSYVAAAKASGKPIDSASYQAAVLQKAKDLIGDTDPASIAPADALDWASVYQAAHDYKGTEKLADSFIATKPEATQAYQARMLQISAATHLEDIATLKSAFAATIPTKTNEAMSMAYMETDAAEIIQKKQGIKAAVQFLNDAEKNFPYSSLDGKAENVNAVKDTLLEEKVGMLVQGGKVGDAKAQLIAANTLRPEDKALKDLTDRIDLIGEPATDLSFTEKYGDYAGLASLKGKVVILDFFAHWCPPCKASMPDMGKLTDDLGSKGVEVVGVTSYYGYYKDRSKKIEKPEEFADMKGFMEDYKIDHPVIFVEHDEFKKYHVPGIPQFVLIDQNGIVRNIQVGYDGPSFAVFRKSVEALLK